MRPATANRSAPASSSGGSRGSTRKAEAEVGRHLGDVGLEEERPFV